MNETTNLSEMRNPKGCLIPIGGAEDKTAEFDNFYQMGILKHILDQIPEGEQPRIEVITSAAAEPEAAFESYCQGFDKLGCPTIGHLNIRSRAEAEHEDTINRLRACNCVMMTGGDQLRLSTTFGGTAALRTICERYEKEHFVVAGTSASAMAMSNPMIYAGSNERANLKGEVKIASGFGLLNNVIIDTHVDKRGRVTRMAQAVAMQPGALGIGLGEDTGLVVTKGHRAQVIGSGSIILIDGRGITSTNVATVSEGKAITIANLTVHYLAAGECYDIGRREFLQPVSRELQ